MKKSTNLTIAQKMTRFNKVKYALETRDFTSITEVAKGLKDNTLISCLSACKIVKPIDGVWHWVGGAITKKMVETVYEAARNKTKRGNGKKTKPASGVPEPVEHADLAEEISKMVEASVKKELAPLVTAMQCSQRHLDIIATKMNIDLS